MIQVVATSTLVVMMMGLVGLDLTLRSFGCGFKGGGWIWGGCVVIVNVVIFPLIVLAIVKIWRPTDGQAVGLVLLAAAPGGPAGVLFARMARGDIAIAVSTQVTMAVVGLFSAPLILSLLLGTSSGGDLFFLMFVSLLLFQCVPLVAGMTLRHLRPTLALSLKRYLGKAVNVLLILVIAGLLIARGGDLANMSLQIHATAVVLVVVPTLLGLAIPGDRRRNLSLGIVTAVRNLSVALMLGSTFYADPVTDSVILTWGFYMFLCTGVLAWWIGRRFEPHTTKA